MEPNDDLSPDYTRMGTLIERSRVDPEFRARLTDSAGPDELRKLGIELPPGVEARIVANTEETMHVVLPQDPSAMLSDESLAHVSGGSGTVSSAATLGTVGSAPSCISSGSSLSSAGSAQIT